MKTRVPLLLAAVASLALTACSKEAKGPEGQVVATVGGKDVTIHEVNAEIAGMGQQAQAAPRKLVESVALARVIERKMLANEARSRKLDQSPQFVLAKTRNDENLLVQALQAEVAGKVPATPREAAQKFISENPIMFGDRRVMTLDQIQFLRTANFASLPLKNAKSMQEVEKMLIEGNVDYRRAPQQIDTLVLDPRLSQEFVKLSKGPNGEPFMYTDQPQAPGASGLCQRRLRNEDRALPGRKGHFLCPAGDPAPGNRQAPAGRTDQAARGQQGQDHLWQGL